MAETEITNDVAILALPGSLRSLIKFDTDSKTRTSIIAKSSASSSVRQHAITWNLSITPSLCNCLYFGKLWTQLVVLSCTWYCQGPIPRDSSRRAFTSLRKFTLKSICQDPHRGHKLLQDICSGKKKKNQNNVPIGSCWKPSPPRKRSQTTWPRKIVFSTRPVSIIPS